MPGIKKPCQLTNKKIPGNETPTQSQTKLFPAEG